MPLGLQTTHSWLILDLANGTAAGNVFVNALDVSYTTPGSATCQARFPSPVEPLPPRDLWQAINVNYLFNGCVIRPPCASHQHQHQHHRQHRPSSTSH